MSSQIIEIGVIFKIMLSVITTQEGCKHLLAKCEKVDMICDSIQLYVSGIRGFQLFLFVYFRQKLQTILLILDTTVGCRQQLLVVHRMENGSLALC